LSALFKLIAARLRRAKRNECVSINVETEEPKELTVEPNGFGSKFFLKERAKGEISSRNNDFNSSFSTKLSR
jgi:hypothetical protein